MKVEQIFTEAFSDNEEKLEFVDWPGKLQLDFDAPLNFVYRTVGREEFEAIKETGVIKPSSFFGRIHAAAIPTEGDVAGHRLLKIRYNPRDGWKAKRASTGVFATTDEEIPAGRIADTFPPTLYRGAASLYPTKFSQYMEFQR